MRAPQICPELPHTAGHVIGVAIQIVHRLQRREIFHGRAGKGDEVHLHALRQRGHEPLNASSIVRRKRQENPETIFKPFEQDPLGRIVLDWSHGSLDLLHLSPDDLIAHELRFELAE